MRLKFLDQQPSVDFSNLFILDGRVMDHTGRLGPKAEVPFPNWRYVKG